MLTVFAQAFTIFYHYRLKVSLSAQKWSKSGCNPQFLNSFNHIFNTVTTDALYSELYNNLGRSVCYYKVMSVQHHF